MTATETITSNERVLGADPLVELRPARGREGEEGFEPEVPGGIGEEDMVTLVLPTSEAPARRPAPGRAARALRHLRDERHRVF